MPTLTNTGAIKSMRLPEKLSEHAEQVGGLGGDNWSHSYRIPGSKFPEITMRYSGFPLIAPETAALRALLAKPAHVVFENDNPQYSNQASKDLVKAVSPALGNSGDNQIYNTQTGFDCPLFHLEKMEVLHLDWKTDSGTKGKRPVLRINGWFHTTEMEPKVYLDCIFIDADPSSKDCRKEELYLQAFPRELFDEYRPEFEKVLSSITWTK